MNHNTIFIVIGTKENVYQDKIGENFVEHPSKEIVKVFSKKEEAEKFIANRRLKKPERLSFGDTSYYKGGFLELEYEEHYIE
jgi:hypothetical protein